MIKKQFILSLILFFIFIFSFPVKAQTVVPLTQPTTMDLASAAATASHPASLASPAAAVVQKIKAKKDADITQTDNGKKDVLTLFLEKHKLKPLSWNNFLQYAIRHAVSQGVPVNTITLVLLFPLVAMIIATSRHVIGLKGFGIYIPAVLSVAFVSTGIINGLIIFTVIAVTAVLAKKLLQHTNLPYLPRTALLLWLVSLGILALLLISPLLPFTTLMGVSIFPILILILLSENFLDAQASTKPMEAFSLIVETLLLAFISALILSWSDIQKFALLEPEIFLVIIAVINILVGKFVGLRLTERLRFKDIIEE